MTNQQATRAKAWQWAKPQRGRGKNIRYHYDNIHRRRCSPASTPRKIGFQP